MMQFAILGGIVNGICNYYAMYKCVLQCLIVACYKFEPSYTSRSPLFGSGSRTKGCVRTAHVTRKCAILVSKIFLNVQMRNMRLFRGAAGYMYVVWQVKTFENQFLSSGNNFWVQNQLKICKRDCWFLQLELGKYWIFDCFLNTRTKRK